MGFTQELIMEGTNFITVCPCRPRTAANDTTKSTQQTKRTVMKLKWLFENYAHIILIAGTAVLAAGCCSHEHSYSQTSQTRYWSDSGTAVGGTAETPESQSGSSGGQVSGTTVIPLHKETANVSTRQVDDGTVRLRKIVKTETVNEPVQLRTESVVIDRQPAATGREGAEVSSQPFQDQEITIQLHHDEPVVQTQIEPAGQVTAQTRTDTRQTTIQKQLRSEDVTVDKGNAKNVTVSGNVSSDSSQAMGGGGDIGGQSSATESSSTITDPTRLTGSDVSGVEGKSVQLNGVKVDRVSGQMICVKDSAGKPLCIKSTESTENLKPGDTINVTGTAKSVSSMPANNMGEASDQASQMLQGQQVYVEAQSVQEAK